jgi:SAM-dependent methyltransferase
MKRFLKQILFKPGVAKRATRLLLKIHDWNWNYLRLFAIASEGGLHPKHRLTNYHQFFVDHVKEGDSVLDVGCSNGVLLRDIVIKTKAPAVGVDISIENVNEAKGRLKDFGYVEIVHCDILDFESSKFYDAIILSNVLEHIRRRGELLSYLARRFRPKRFIIRVPMFEREWLVPYKKEFGLDWRLDSTHEIEYTEEQFREELKEAGLDIYKIIFRWGEMYSIAVPSVETYPKL